MTAVRSPELAPAGPLPEGTRFGRYRTLGRIGGGGMAEVYLASLVGDFGFEQTFVLKRILPQLTDDARFVTMLADEARLAARVRHRSVAQVIELVSTPELAIVMELVEGETLSGLLRALSENNAWLPLDVTAYLVSEIAAGLHAAHSLTDPATGALLRLVHRDVSPSNVMVAVDGAVKLLDFGVAAAEGRLAHTRTGEVKGKIAYTAPEALDGGRADPRWDVFSLGCVLWECLTRSRLFRRETEAATMRAVLEGEVLPPSSVVPGIPAAVDETCLRALSRDPAQRTATMVQLREELLPFVKPTSADALAAILRAHCAGRLESLSALRRESSAGSSGGHPVAYVDQGSRVRITQTARSHRTTPPRSGALAALVGVVAAGLGAGATYLAVSRDTKEPLPALVVPVVPAAVPPSLPPPIAAAPTAMPTTMPTTGAPPEPRAEVAPTRDILVTSDPEGAEVREGEVVLGRAPVRVAVGATTREITLYAPGHRPMRVRLDADSRERIDVQLSRIARSGGSSSRSSSSSSADYDLWD